MPAKKPPAKKFPPKKGPLIGQFSPVFGVFSTQILALVF
jgi:hypothetical protein